MKNKIILIPITILIIFVIISFIYNTFPRLQLNGPTNMTISYREEYEEQGVIVKNATGNYMSKIKIDKNIDNKKIGNYYIDYSLTLGGNFLMEEHTVDNLYSGEFWSPTIKVNQSYDNWAAEGYPTVDKDARKLVNKIIEEGNKVPLDAAVEDTLNKIIKTFEEE